MMVEAIETRLHMITLTGPTTHQARGPCLSQNDSPRSSGIPYAHGAGTGHLRGCPPEDSHLSSGDKTEAKV